MDPPRAEITWVFPNSWTQDYEVYCDKKSTRDLSKSMVTATGSSIMFVLLVASDLVGRLEVLRLSWVISAVAMWASLSNIGYLAKIFLVGVAGGGGAIYIALFTMLINECTRNP